MQTERLNREQRNRTFRRAVVSVTMFALIAGGVFSYSMYQGRKATEAVIYERNAAGELTADGGAQTVYLAGDTPVQDFTDVDTYQYYQAFKDDWIDAGDGTVWYQDKHYRRNSYVKAILAIGVDRKDGLSEEAVEDYYGTGQSDAMIVIAQDTARNHLRMLMLPRDSIVEMDLMDLEGNITGSAVQNLTLAWAFGDGGSLSAANAVNTVSRMLCGLSIDHYAASNMAVLGAVNDAVGGVTVTIPNDELAKRYPEWTKGSTVTLHGDEAEHFLRYRDTDMDGSPVYRMQQHRAYILGFYSAVRNTSRSDSNIVTELYELVQGNMITDMNKAEVLKLGMDAIGTDGLESADIVTLPGVAIPPDDNWPYDRVFVDYRSAIPVILDMFYREI